MEAQEVAVRVEAIDMASHEIDTKLGVKSKLGPLVVMAIPVRGRVRRRTVTLVRTLTGRDHQTA